MTRVVERWSRRDDDDGDGVGESVLVVRCPDCSVALGSVPASHGLEDAKLPVYVKRLVVDLANLPGDQLALALELLGVTGYLGSVTLYADALFTCRRCGGVVRAAGPAGRVVAECHLDSVFEDQDD